MAIKSFDDLKSRLKADSHEQRTVAVANAADEHTLQAVLSLYHEDYIRPLLVGDKDAISQLLADLNEDVSLFDIYHETTPESIAAKAVSLVKEGAAQVLLKGGIQTRDLLKAVVNKETGIRKPGVLSHVAINEVPTYHKLLLVSDGGMVLTPDVKMKQAILDNALSVYRGLGYDQINVGILDASENVNPKLQASQDAVELKELAGTTGYEDVKIEGPISLDLSISKDIAEAKGYDSEIAGDMDVLLVPDIVTGNVLGKSLTTLAGGKMAGLIIGAEAPIVLTSRGSSMEEKLNSLLLAISL